MSAINYYRKIVKNLVKTSEIPNHIMLNKKYPINNISSNEMVTKRNKDLIFKLLESKKHSYDSKSKINNSNSFSKKQQELSIPNIYSLNKTAERPEKNHYFSLKENKEINNSAKPNKTINLSEVGKDEDNSNNKIYLSKLYRLPNILNNDYLNIKLSSLKKKTVERPTQTEIKNEETIKSQKNKGSSIDYSETQNIFNRNQRMNKVLDDINNKNMNINVINFNKICVKRNINPIKIVNKTVDSESNKKNNNDEELIKLQNVMKDKFFKDTEIRMNKKLKNKPFNIDRSLKDKIIEMKKIGDFWGGIVNYCCPVINIKKYECEKGLQRLNRIKIRNLNSNKELLNEETTDKHNLSDIKKNERNEAKSQRLFTINSLVQYRHKKKIENKKEFLEKYNDSLQYYML